MKSKKIIDNRTKQDKDTKLKLPDSYYINYEAGITRRQVDEVVVEQMEKIKEKLYDSVCKFLKHPVSDDILYSAINSAFIESIKQYDKNPQKVTSKRDFFSYWLVSSWRDFRNTSIKEQKLSRLHVTPELPNDFNGEDDSLSHFEVAAAEESTEKELSDFFGSEEFATFVHERVYDYLDDCYLDGIFTIREISIFKIYCVNNYSIERMAKDTQFSRTRIISALSKIKKHLATVDFRWYQFHPDLANN